MSKKPSYEELVALNEHYRNQVLQLQEEVNILRKSFLPEESYYKDRFYRITENVNDVVYRLTLPECRYEYMSPQARQLFGYSPEDFYNAPIIVRRLIHPDFFTDFIYQWRLLLSGQAPEYYEIKIITKSGDVRWVQQKNLLIKDENGQALAIEGIVTDITNRKTTQEALINSEAQKKAILNNLPHMAWLKDCDGKYLSVNDSFANFVGKPIEKIVGRTDYDLYPEERARRFRDEDIRIILTKKQYFNEEQNDDRWFETFKAPIFDTNGHIIGVTGISLEISKRKRAEEEIRNYSEKLAIQNVKLKIINDEIKTAKEKAEESDKLKSAFLANMSHEIRTPMNAILGFSTLIRNRVLSEEKRKDYLELVNSNCRQLLRIISDIIDIAKIEAGQISIFNKNFNLNKALHELYMNFSNQLDAMKKPIQLSLKTGLNNEESSIFSDKVRLEQILANLLSNAIKFTDEGSIEFGYYIDKRSDIIFFVKDTGIGMTQKEQAVIFDRFRQVSSSYSKIYGGTGLGLSISKGLTEKLGGKIWLESEVDVGSTFYFNIPYKPGARADKMPQIEYSANYNWKGKIILIAEDEEINYNLLETIILPTKAKIIRAKNGLEAVEICQKTEHIDLVLMDIKMPDMNGFDATKKIKLSKKDLPIIAQTAYAMSVDEDNCLRAGCDDYIAKPLQIDDLLNKVNQYLFGSKPIQTEVNKEMISSN